jgi:hypothetical protein
MLCGQAFEWLQVRSILDHDEELEALLSRVAASRRLVIDVDPAEKTRRGGQALVAVTIALTANLRAAPGKGSRSCPRSTPTASTPCRRRQPAHRRRARRQDTKPDPGNEGDGDTEQAS